ncbi:MAG TPA: type II toxin-antitoxin system HicA family toxin [Geminicoccaceae bacterium]|nr:type II toxin-antitoxin system HicA family toxin [Geminicoccus sp.]HMU52363.1 type II toxin-antitoxin system HicA family toxin [Geminicoccaceae bacterium]
MKLTNELIRTARRLGWRVEPTHGGHLRLKHPSGALVFAGSMPSDRRSLANALATMRRELRRCLAEPMTGEMR